MRAFVDAFAGRAYRRPLSAAELDSLNQEIADLSALGSDPQEIAQYGVYAVLMAPEFLYRTEFGGSSSSSDVALTPYEMATGAVSLRYRLNLLGEVVIDPVHVPEFSPALEDAMATESRMFLDEVLWHGQLGDLMTSTASFVNTDLATIVYGIPAPAGATATDFVRVELPADQRAGVLTRAAFLTELARTESKACWGAGSPSRSAWPASWSRRHPMRSRRRSTRSSRRAPAGPKRRKRGNVWRCPTAPAVTRSWIPTV